ncbi:MAG: SWIM zinc finger family protein, partial [Thermoplasmata archaeon]|nr:SWIM zinc finger family protein [Thermoplasmata archaeon]
MDLEATLEAVRRKAGPSVYARGKRYYLGNRVSAVREVDGALAATVRGTDEYEVRVGDGGAPWSCDCPYDRICKHGVAVVLKAAEEGIDVGAQEPDLAGEFEWAAEMLRSAKRRADAESVMERVSSLLSEAHGRSPAEAESLLRTAMVLFRGTPAEDEVISRWTASMAAADVPAGAAGLLSEVLREAPERALPALSTGRFAPADASALLEAVSAADDPSVEDSVSAARMHLLGLLGRTEEVLEGLAPDLPAEAIVEACSFLRTSFPEECNALLRRSLEGRTPRETFALCRCLADLTSGTPEEADSIAACVAIAPDPALVRRLVGLDAD